MNTCGGRGHCDSTTGQCICEVNWRGDTNCTSCSPGWNGTRCQLAVMSLLSISHRKLAIASIGGSGYFSTFFGVSFTYRIVGEFYLVRSLTDNFAIQLRQAPCVRLNTFSALCTTGFAFTFKNLRITIRAHITSASQTAMTVPIIWLNGRLIRVNHVTHLSVHFRMVRISTLTYHIYGPRGIRFVVTVGQSLAVTVHVPREYCNNATGLLGACRDHNPANGTNVEDLVKSLIDSSTVRAKDSLFVYRYLRFYEHQVVTGGGFSLYFKDSYVRSMPIFFSEFSILTIELLVKVHQHGGVILSYAQSSTFAILNDVTVKISYKGRVLDTGVTLEIREWNQISLVFKQSVGILHFYLLDSTGQLKARVFKLDAAVFMSGGVLVLGQWQTSRAQSTTPPNSSFVGEIDELRIWQRRSNPDLVKLNWRLNVQPGTYPGLLHLWKLNQVEGTIVRDLVAGSHLYIIRFHEPLWSFSNADIPRVSPVDTTFPNSSLQSKAQTFCFSLLLEGFLFDRCEPLGYQVAQFYYRACLKDISVSADPRWAMYAVVTYADYCQAALDLTLWPAVELCSNFPDQRFPYMAGYRCKTPCRFGYPVPSQNASDGVKCMCEPGYWGSACSNLCPGGLWNVCSGHGVCDSVNGSCECDAHWNGNATSGLEHAPNSSVLPCSVCTEGWSGSDCSIAVEASIENSTRPGISINFGDPHFTTVTGENYNYEAPGAFLLFNSSVVTAQILQVPCKNRVSCRRISELALHTAATKLFVRYTDQETLETGLLNYAQDSVSKLSNSREWVEVADMQYRWVTANILEVGLPEEVQFNILMYNGTIGSAIEVPRTMRDNTRGLCGHAQGTWIKRLREKTANNSQEAEQLNQKALDRRLSHLRVQEKENILTTKFASSPFSGAGYMLEFNHNQLMLASDASSPVLSEFTIEIWVCLVNEGVSASKTCSAQQDTLKTQLTGKHAVLSASTNTGNLAIMYNEEITVVWDQREIHTGLTVYAGQWTHVGVTWRTHDGRVQVFVENQASSNTSSEHGVNPGGEFSFDGFVVLGRHMQGYDVIGEHDMRGALDELRVWQYAKTEAELKSLRSVKFDSYLEGLVLYLPLDEGTGIYAEGKLYSVLPVGPSQEGLRNNDTLATFHVQPVTAPPIWAPSSVPMSPLSNYTLDFRNKSLMEQAKERCYVWFYTGKVQQYCSSVLVSQSRFYYESCLADIADSGSLAHYKFSVSLFGFYCQKVLGIKECLLYGTYDGFQKCPTTEEPKSKDLTPTEIVVIGISVIFFVLFVLIIIIVLCRRRRKKNRQRDKVMEVYLSEPEGRRYRVDEGHGGDGAGQGVEMDALYHRGLLDPYGTDSEQEDTPTNTPALQKKLLFGVRNPAGEILDDEEDESCV